MGRWWEPLPPSPSPGVGSGAVSEGDPEGWGVFLTVWGLCGACGSCAGGSSPWTMASAHQSRPPPAEEYECRWHIRTLIIKHNNCKIRPSVNRSLRFKVVDFMMEVIRCTLPCINTSSPHRGCRCQDSRMVRHTGVHSGCGGRPSTPGTVESGHTPPHIPTKLSPSDKMV